MISSERIPPVEILCIFIGAIQQVCHLERERELTKKTANGIIERRAFSQKSDVPHTNSSMYFFLQLNLCCFLVSHEALIILKRATKRTHQRKNLPVYLK